MKKIRILRVLLFSIFLILLNCIVENNIAQANIYDVSEVGYDTAVTWSWDTAKSKDISDDSAGNWQKDDQIQCLEGSKTADGANRLALIIDINTDGDNPDGGKICINGTWKNLPDNKLNAKMACMAYIAESTPTHSVNTYSTFKNPFAYFYQFGGYRSYLQNICGNFTLPNTNESESNISYAKKESAYTKSDEYMENYETAEVTYSARILIYNGGDGQSRAIVYGKKTENNTKFTIDKYINKVVETSSDGGTTDYGTTRANQENTYKSDNPVKISDGDVKIYYTITITNEGSKTLTGELTDTFSTGFLSDLQVVSGGTIGQTISIESGKTKTYKITLVGNSNVVSGKYKNTATFTASNGTSKSSSDWVSIEQVSDVKINKYITKISNTSFSRSSMSENQKANSPAGAGKNTSSKTIYYTITIYNPNSTSVKGKFKDTVDSGITINSISCTNNSKITIPAKSTKTITVVASAPQGISGGIYVNTAKFTYNDTTVKSSDYFEIGEDDSSNATIKKYISSVSGSPGSYKSGRASMSASKKNKNPAEVVNGSFVTYTIELKNEVKFSNTSEECDGNYCSHSTKVTYLKCKDTYDKSKLQYVSYSSNSGGTYNSSTGEITWKKVKQGDTVSINITFKVIASNMQVSNIENKVGSISYEYTKYSCTAYHGKYKTASIPIYKVVNNVTTNEISSTYTYTYCTHTDCGFNHNSDTVTGTINGSDADYVRVLDPEVAGNVWVETTLDGYKTGSEGLTGMTAEQKKITVKLVCDGSEVASRVVDSNGNYSFGRVRKGANRKITSGSVNDYDNIGTGKYFYYTSDTLLTYTLEFYYDGEKFESTTYSGSANLNSNHSMKNGFYTDSNAKENLSERTTFNNSLETISYNTAYAGTSEDSNNKILAYNISNSNSDSALQTSELKWDGNLSNSATSSITMKATSFQIFYANGDIEYLKHMNLGLVPRNRADMSIQKDVYTAEVTVNGYQTKYIYDGFTNSNINSNNTIKTPYKLKIYNEDYTFRTSNYDSEIQSILNVNNAYDTYGRSNDLEVLITYKITIKNNSTVSTPTFDNSAPSIKIREIVDYSSNEMTVASNNGKAEVRVQSISGNYLGISNSTTFNSVSSSGSGYNKNIITGLENYSIAAGKSLDIFITYKVNKSGGGIIVDNYENSTTTGVFNGKYNVAEIGSYSIYKANGTTPAGLVDRNSNPASLSNPTNTKTYEDDTFQTTINVVLRTETDPSPTSDPNPESNPIANSNIYRMISGNVWEEIGEDVGDGIKNGNDVGAPNVIVKLYEVVEDTGSNTEYLVDTGIWQRTKIDGNYVFGGVKTDYANGSTNDKERLHAGRYVVRFIYGDEPENLKEYTVGSSLTAKTSGLTGMTIRYSGQDYKSAIYKEVGSTNENEVLEATAFNKTSNGAVYSFAKDNEQRRMEVNAYSSTMTYSMDEILKATTAEEKEILAANTSMYADTKKFNIQIENCDKYNATNDSKYHVNISLSGAEVGKGNHTIVGGKTYIYSIKNINFGLIERPITKLELMNDITEIIAQTEDGTIILDAKFDVIYTYEESGTSSDTASDVRTVNHYTIKNEEESIGLDKLQVLNRSKSNQGFRYANIDTDIMQGLTITLKFRIAIANLSEPDYISYEGYKLVENSIVEVKESYSEASAGSSLSTLTKTPLDSSGYDYNTYYNDNKITNVLAYKLNNHIIVKTSEYNYSNRYNSSMNTLLSQSQSLKTANTSKEYNYNGGSPVGTPAVSTSYTYNNLSKKVSGYYYGYYIGNYYYRGTTTAASYNSSKDVVVETRVDQIIDFVDNDLVFKSEENVVSNGSFDSNLFTTYSIPEITEKGLLKGILGNSSLSSTLRTNAISDSQQDFVSYNWSKNTSSDHNNLAFSVEDSAKGNSTLYKYLTNSKTTTRITINENNLYNNGEKQDINGDNKYSNMTVNVLANPFEKNKETYLAQVANNLYYVDLQASRVLSSEKDAGIQLENLAEIVKVSNNVGRKVDVTSSLSTTGYLGNTTEKISTLYNNLSVVTLSKEADTDFTESVTFSPPTGLSQEKIAKLYFENNIVKTVEIIIAVLIIIVGSIYVVIQFVKRKKFYK